jgi:hypothetical protein
MRPTTLLIRVCSPPPKSFIIAQIPLSSAFRHMKLKNFTISDDVLYFSLLVFSRVLLNKLVFCIENVSSKFLMVHYLMFDAIHYVERDAITVTKTRGATKQRTFPSFTVVLLLRYLCIQPSCKKRTQI